MKYEYLLLNDVRRGMPLSSAIAVDDEAVIEEACKRLRAYKHNEEPETEWDRNGEEMLLIVSQLVKRCNWTDKAYRNMKTMSADALHEAFVKWMAEQHVTFGGELKH